MSPARWFSCPDKSEILIDKCLSFGGCPFPERCAPIPYLRLVGFDREWRGVTPSQAGNGPRLIWLKAVTDYTVDPEGRAWAALGIGTHSKLAVHAYNVLAEEELSDELQKGITDVLEQDETDYIVDSEGKAWRGEGYILTDYKTYGSYKVTKCIGIKQIEENILDKDGNPILYASGEKKGKVKTKKVSVIDPASVDLAVEELQLNSYRILFSKYGFHITRMRLFVIPRDGATFVAEGRGITRNTYMIPIRKLPDKEVLDHYSTLRKEVDEAFKNKDARMCSKEESWQQRRCDPKYCEVFDACKGDRK
jgi:hypothetical protein